METVTTEKIVATVDAQAVETEVANKEKQQNADNRLLAAKAKEYIITTDEQYQEAAEIGKEIKRRAKMVTDLFQPIKDAANKAHKAACAREKEMLVPLQEAEKAIKASMGAYVQEQERKRREAEEAARKAREEEVRRMLEQAVDLEQQGRKEEADEALENAEVMSETPVVVSAPVPAAKGVTTKKVWEIRVTDHAKVPVYIMGVNIRPVDEMAIKKLVNASKGQIQIPGIEIIEKAQTILRT